MMRPDLDRGLASYLEADAFAPAPDWLLESVLAELPRRPRPRWRASLHAAVAGAGAGSDLESNRGRLVLALVVLALMVALVVAAGGRLFRPVVELPIPPYAGVFEPVGDMPFAARLSVALADGRTLVIAGGLDAQDRFGIATYDPDTGRFSTLHSTLGDRLLTANAAAAFPDGAVAVVGQAATGEGSVVVFEPDTGAARLFRAAGGASPVPVALADGRILLVGGERGGVWSGAEILDPRAGTVRATGPMARERGSPATATLLLDGRVLIVSGAPEPTASAELFDPTTGTFTPVGSLAIPRTGFTATLLLDGRVLIAGGIDTTGDGSTDHLAAVAEIFDPRTGSFTQVGALAVPRVFHVAALLRDGRVLLAGGMDPVLNSRGVASAELFDPVANRFSRIADMTRPRQGASAVRLPSGEVLIVGSHCRTPNCQDDGAQVTAEIFR
jgi:hypothetical protein